MATKQELEAEYSRIKKQLEEIEYIEKVEAGTKFQHRMDLLRKAGTDWVDGLVPYHGRISCSDENLSNGFHSDNYGTGVRCTRCALLQIVKGYHQPTKELNIYVTFT